MIRSHLLTCSALSIILAAASAVPAFAQLQDEIIVTATKRSESAADIPIAVTALGEDTLEELNVNIFTDYLMQLPSVSAGGSGPGTSTIYIRGLASTTPTLSVAGVAGLAPNVAFYLDEQPLSQPGRNLDVYAADLERVEVLAGPQGTLFGASSQAGTVRMITNKPKIGVSEASFKAGTSFTKGGEMSYNAEIMSNIPVGDKLALRGVFYLDDQGGYIDNVQGSQTLRDSARFRTASTVRSNGTTVGSIRQGFQAGATVAETDALLSNVNFLASDNSALVEDDFNDTRYVGFRLGGLYEFNDDWSLSLGYAHQELDSEGVFFMDPTLGDDLDIQRYSEDSLEDDFDNFSATLKGRIAGLEALYTGAFTKRRTDQKSDYTDYMFVGQYLPYYLCDRGVAYSGPPGSYAAPNPPTGTCQAPDARLPSRSRTNVQTHEFRVTTPSEHRLRATGGVFYSDLKLEERNDFTYIGAELTTSTDGMGGTLVGFGPGVSTPGATLTDTGVFPENVLFRNDITRTDEQFGVFGEATFDINEQFALTVGARYYDVKVDLKGAFSNLFGFRGSTVTDTNVGRDLDTLFDGDPNPDKALSSGVIFKATGTWTPNSDMLFYGTFSQGFRPGLLNRPGGTVQASTGYQVPFFIDTDDVNNFEFGWKTTLADNQLRFNGSAFFVDVSDLQTTIFDPNIVNLFFSDNAADAQIKGVEGDITYAPRAIEGLTVSGAFSVLDTEITNVITPTGDVVKGDPLAFAPSFQGNLRARYEWDTAGGYVGHIMPSVAYSGKSNSDILQFNSDVVKGYTTVGLALGISSDTWTGEIFANNLLDDRGELSRFYGNDRQRVTPVKPRTIGARVAYNFR